MITDNASLNTTIASWLKRDDLAANIPDFIAVYEAQMNRELNNMNPPHHALTQTISGTFAETGESPFRIALPTGYKGTKRFQVLDGGNYRTLTYKTPQQMAHYNYTGKPRYYTIIGNYIEVATSPNDDTPYTWEYIAPMPSITAGSNWMIENAPDAYLYGSLIHSAPFLKNDGRIQTWVGLYAKILDDLELENSRYHYSGGTLQQRSDSAVR